MFFSSIVRVLAPACLLVACAPSNASVATATQAGTNCAAERLGVFNYDRSKGTWLAACGENLFVCADKRTGASCTPQNSANLDPALLERVRTLQEVPQPQRDAFVSTDIAAGTWDQFAKKVASAKALKPGQVQAVSDLSRLYTDFSPEFDAALGQCLGPDGVATISVAKNGGIAVSPNQGCLVGLRGASDLAPLRARLGEVFQLAVGVRAIVPVSRPIDPEVARAEAEAAAKRAAEPPPPSELSKEVRAWLDSASKEVTSCAGAPQVVVSVTVDTAGLATLSLRDELAGSPAEGCIRAALPSQAFSPGPETIVHLVRAPEPAPDAVEAPAKSKKKPASSPTGAKPAPAQGAPQPVLVTPLPVP